MATADVAVHRITDREARCERHRRDIGLAVRGVREDSTNRTSPHAAMVDAKYELLKSSLVPPTKRFLILQGLAVHVLCPDGAMTVRGQSPLRGRAGRNGLAMRSARLGAVGTGFAV